MATIASLIVNVAADTAQLVKGVDQVNRSLDSVEKFANKVGTALVAAFSTTAIIAAGKRVIDYAGHLTDLSQKTGIGVVGLQKLELAFEQNGVALDTVTAASAKLAKNLVGGDKTAVGALEKLGLSVSELKKMAPEDQFITVADAIGKIPNPTEKAYAAIAIFGKGGAELLAGFTGSLQQTIGELERMGVIIDEQTIKAADDFGDQLTVLSKVGLAFIAKFLAPALPGLMALAQWLATVGGAATQFGKDVEDFLIRALFQAAIAFNKLLLAIAEGSQSIPLLGKHLGASAETVARLREQVSTSELRLKIFSTSTTTLGEAAKKTTPPLIGLGDAVEKIGPKAAKAAEGLKLLEGHFLKLTDPKMEISGLPMVGLIQDLGEAARDHMRDLQPLDAMLLNFGTVTLPNVTSSLAKAGTAGKGFFGGLFGGLKDKLDPGKILNSMIGGGLSSLISGGIGLAAKGLGALFGKLFGGEGRKTNAMRDEFIAAAGGLAQLQEKAAAAGLSLDVLFAAKDRKSLEAAISSINKGLDTHAKLLDDIRGKYADVTSKLQNVHDISPELQGALEKAFSAKTPADFANALGIVSGLVDDQIAKQNHLNGLVSKYGLDWTQAGSDFKAAKIDEIAGGLISDFNDLKGIFPDLNVVMRSEFGTAIQDFVDKAQKAGVAVPLGMQPILQVAIDAGRLLDDNGQKVQHLEDLHLTFADKGETAMDKVTSALGRLVDVLEKHLNPGLNTTLNTIAAIPSEKNVRINIDTYHDDFFSETHGGDPVMAAARGGLVTTHGLVPQYFGSGGNVLPFMARGSDTVPAMLTPGELVLNRHQAHAYRASSGGDRALLEKLDQMRADQARRDAQFPKDLARAVRDAVQTAGRRA
jgi:hypothetical protein